MITIVLTMIKLLLSNRYNRHMLTVHCPVLGTLSSMGITEVTRQPESIWKDYGFKAWLTKNAFPKNGESRPFPLSDCIGTIIPTVGLQAKEIKMRMCKDCKFDMDAESAIACTGHKWHNNDTYDDMCCLCGLDAEMLLK